MVTWEWLVLFAATFVLAGIIYRSWRDELLPIFRRSREQLGEHEALPEEMASYRVTGPTEIELEAPSEFIKDPEVAVRRANDLADDMGLTYVQRRGVATQIRRVVRDGGYIDDDSIMQCLGVSERRVRRHDEDTVALVSERQPVLEDASWADVMIRYVRDGAPEVYVASPAGWRRDESDTRRIGVCLENAVVVMSVVQHKGLGNLMRELDPHLTVDHWKDIPEAVRSKVEALPKGVRTELIRTLKLQRLYEHKDREPTERYLDL